MSAEEKIKAAIEQLRRVEWISKFDAQACMTVTFCPECYMWVEYGHASDCKLRSTLELLESRNQK